LYISIYIDFCLKIVVSVQIIRSLTLALANIQLT